MMREATFSNPTPGSWLHCGPVQPPAQVQVWLPPSALHTRTRRDQHTCTRDIDTCKLRAGTDKTRANGGEKLWQRDAEERQNRTKKRGAKREKELSSWYCCTVQYLQVPWLPQGFSSQPVGCSHVSPRHPDTHVHSYAPSSSPAARMHVSATRTHETNGTKAQAAAQSAPLPLSLATRASQSATTSA